MAYTRIHAIKTTLTKALDYIENPEKTQEQLLVSGYNVDPLSASVEYRMTAALGREVKGDYAKTGGADILAYHMIQSFSPYDKITAEQAHELGKKWADEILQGKYEYVISTHVDKGHIHNHIIFNSVSFYDYKKYETKPYKTAELLRKTSDRLCEDQGLSVIHNPKLNQKRTTHYEWEQRKAGTSWKAKIKEIIDTAISETTDYESFKEALLKANVEIKEGKRISFRIKGTAQERFCRGDRIGEEYSKEKIIERLATPKDKKPEKETTHTEQKTETKPVQSYRPEEVPTFTTFDKKVEWQAQRTKLAATKELAAALLTIRKENIQKESDFDIRASSISEKAASVRSTMTELAGKNQQYKNAAKYLLAYKQYLPIKQELEKQLSFRKAKYALLHESELTAFDHAAAQLEKLGVNTNVDPDKVIALVRDQDGKVAELSGALKETMIRIDAIRQAQQLVNAIQKQKGELEKEKRKGRE